MKAKAKAKPQTRRKAKRKGGQQPHVPTAQTLATVRAMAGVGYSQETIARHIGVSPPTLRGHYRQLLDNAIESVCAQVFACLVRTATTRMDNAGVQAGKFILSCRAGWREVSKLELEEPSSRGLTAILRIVADTKADEAIEAALAAEDAAFANTLQPDPAPSRH